MKTNIKKLQNFQFFVVVLLSLLFFILFSFFSHNDFAKGTLTESWTITIDENISCHDISSKGNFVAAGTQAGVIFLYNKKGEEIFSHDFGNPILDLQFSFDETTLLVQCYSIYCIDITEQRVTWEKYYQPDSFYIQDFWVFQDGKIGFLASSLNSLENYYFLTNSEGVTIDTPYKLPNSSNRFQITPSPDGKLLIWTTEEGTIECMSYFGFVHWSKQITFPGKEISGEYPFLQTINNNGVVAICFPSNTTGAQSSTLLIVNMEGVVLWESTYGAPVKSVDFSSQKNTILVATDSIVYLYDLSGDCLLTKEKFGYNINNTEVFYSHYLVSYSPTNELRPRYLQKEIIELNWLQYDIWRKHANATTRSEFSGTDNGYIFLEVNLPNRLTLYQYHFLDPIRKV